MPDRDWQDFDDRLRRLEAQMAAAFNRITVLEAPRNVPDESERMARPAVPAAPRVPAPPVVPPSSPVPPAPAVRPAPVFEAADEEPSGPSVPPRPAAPQEERPGFAWETFIGRQAMLWAGTLLVFLTVGYLLAITWNALGPVGRLIVGATCGLVMLGGGELARTRVERGFGEGLCGGGLAVLYLDAWAAMARYQLISFDAVLPVMVLITVAGVALAVRHDCVSLHALATIGGFVTPALAPPGIGSGSPVPFLVYLAVLNAGILGVALIKAWRPTVWLSFAATILVAGGWADRSYTPDQRWVVFAFVTVYFLLYAAAAAFRGVARREKTGEADVLLLVADALVYMGAGLALTQPALVHFPSAFPLALAALFGVAALTVDREDTLLHQAAAALGLLFLTLAVPIQLKQGWIAVAWGVEAAVLCTLSVRYGGRLLRHSGQIVWALAWVGAAATAATVTPRMQAVFLNEAALPLTVAVLGSGWMAAFARRRRSEDEAQPFYAGAAVLGGAWLLAQETVYGMAGHLLPWPSAWAGDAGTGYAICTGLAVYAVAAFVAGMRLGDRVVRGCALSVGAIAVAMAMGAGIVMSHTRYAPILNPRLMALAVSAAALGTMAWLASHEKEGLDENELEATGYLPLGAHAAIVCAVSVELYSAAAAGAAADWAGLAWLAIASFWAVYAIPLVLVGWIYGRIDQRRAGYGLAAAAVCVAVGGAAVLDLPLLPAWNGRALAYLCVLAALAAIGWMGRLYEETGGSEERDVPKAAVALMVGVGLWALTQEAYGACQYFQATIGPNWERWAQSAVSLVWTLFASGLLAAGISRDMKTVRFAGLGLFAATVVKVMIFDLAFMEMQYRILSTAVLGIALIGGSWLYSRSSIGSEAGDGLHRQAGVH